MPVKILLADKSITIQKVVEMLFSGKEFEVTCVSDGETALSEAARIVPGVVLADVDLPRLDGYGFAARLKATPALANVPVILMLSRDDQYDVVRGRQAGITDNIAKPFESQDLIGKVKKALAAAPPPATAPAPPPRRPAAAPPPPPRQAVVSPPQRPKPPVPSDIFSIIQEAPAKAAPAAPTPPAKPQPVKKIEEEEVFEVEPEFEIEPETEAPVEPAAAAPLDYEVPPPAEAVDMEIEAEILPETPAAGAKSVGAEELFGKEPPPAAGPAVEPSIAKGRKEEPPSAPTTFDFSAPLPSDAEAALPLGARAVEEMREGLGLAHPDIVSFESLDMASRGAHEYYASPVEEQPPLAAPPPEEAPREPAPPPPSRPPVVTDAMLEAVCRESVEKIARDVLERVAWEVIPDLAERLIREEIERLKSES
jgi:CheY-like chemotaxis protein